MGLEEGVRRGTDEFHGKIRVSFLLIKLLPKRDTGSLGISQNTKPALLVEVPKFKPFVKQVLRNAEALTELLYGAKVCKVLSQKPQNKVIIPLRRSRLSGKTGTMIPVSGNHHEPA